MKALGSYDAAHGQVFTPGLNADSTYVAVTSSSQAVAIPIAVGAQTKISPIIWVYSDGLIFAKFGADNSISVTGSTGFPIPAGLVPVGVPPGANFIALITTSTANAAITPISNH